MIIFSKQTPHELWSLKPPTATAIDGSVKVTLIVCADAPPSPAIETEVVLWLSAEEAEHLKSQTEVAAGRAQRQLR
jgi:hypothetical protein